MFDGNNDVLVKQKHKMKLIFFAIKNVHVSSCRLRQSLCVVQSQIA